MSDKEFPDGLIFKLPRDGAPEYVSGSLSIKKAEFIEWLSSRDGDWVNLNLKRSQGGKAYAEVDNWKPERRPSGSKPAKVAPPMPAMAGDFGDDIPF